MDLKATLLKEHSKGQCNKIVTWIGSNQQRFDELFKLFTSDEYRVVQRAAWPVSYCVIANPKFIQKHFAKIFSLLQKPKQHVAVKRNTLRLLQEMEFPEKYHGIAIDCCMKFISSMEEAIAVKAFALTVLENLSKKYPEILPEIKLIIKEQLPYATPAFKVRARRIINNY